MRDVALSALATQQHGVVTAAQLAELGLSSSGISYRASVGRLHRIRRGVYAVGHRRLSQHGLWMAAVLAVGEGAVLSHLCAAVLWQAWRRTARTLDVLAPRSLRRHRGIRVRRCRSLDSRDVTVHDSVPVTTVARTLVDLTDVLTAAQLANVIHEAGFRGRFDLVATRAAMARANGRRVGVLERALELTALGSAGTKSGLEDRSLALLRSAGLPEPLPNVQVLAGGRKIEVDLYWPGLGLCAEGDGPGHARPRTRRDDVVRDRLLTAAGFEALRLDRIDAAAIAAIRARSPRGP